MLAGHKGAVLGVLNKRSLAAFAARHLLEQGAELACSYLPGEAGDMRRVQLARAAVPGLAPDRFFPLDVTMDDNSPQSMCGFFSAVDHVLGDLDFVVHAIAMVPASLPEAPVTGLSRAAFLQAVDVSVYSLITAAREARSRMPRGGALVTYSYLSSQALVAGYELLGICKGALESAARQLARELAPDGIRVNIVSAAPARTTAAIANPAFDALAATYVARAPLARLATPEEISRVVGFLVSNASAGMTGECLFVDGGFRHAMVV